MKKCWKQLLAILMVLMMLCAPAMAEAPGNDEFDEFDEFDSFDDYSDSDDSKTADEEYVIQRPSVVSVKELIEATPSLAEISESARTLYAPIAGTVIRIPVFAEPGAGTLKMKEAFEEEFGCTVLLEVYGWNEWRAQVIQMVAAKNVPDAVPIFDEQFILYVTQGIVQPIDEFVDLDDPIWKRDLSELYSWNGNLYGAVKGEADVITIYYNKDLVREYGLEDPYELYLKGKWDFDAFRKTAKALTIYNGEKRKVIGFSTWITDVLCLANGNTSIILQDDGTIVPTIQEKSWLEGMEVTQKMIVEDKSFDPGDTASTKFLAGRVGMYAERASYFIAQYDMYNNAPFEIGFVPLPKGPSTEGEIAPAIVESFGVPTGAKNPLGAMAWYYFTQIYSNRRLLSGEETVWNSFYKKWTDEHYCQFYDYVSRAHYQYSFVNGIGDWFTKRWGLLMDIENGTPPAVAVERHIGELLYEIKSMTGQE